MAKETTKKGTKKETAAKKAPAKAPAKKEAAVETVTKTALIEKVAEMTEQPKTVTSDIINASIDAIMEEVAAGKQVQIKGFMTYGYRVKEAREGRNPQTGDTIQIAEQPVTTAKVGREFKRVVKEAYKPAKKK